MTALAGKTAVITGATSGIGVDVARSFVAEGAQVLLAGRRKEHGDAVAEMLGSAATFVQVDVSIEDEVAALVTRALDQYGALDIVVNNAGAPATLCGMADVDIDAFRRVLDVNLYGPLYAIKHAAAHMQSRGQGSIINIGSVAGRSAAVSGLDYSTSKAALQHLTRWAAMELGEHGVRVNCVSPGFIATGIFAKAAGLSDADAERSAARLAAEFAPELAKVQPVSRPGVGADVAAAVVFLASDAARYINGHDLALDGGMTVRQPYSVMRAQRTRIADIVAGR